MARIRTVKPDFFTSPTVARLTLRARLTFVGLWCYVDDAGRGYDDARLVKAVVWPLDDDVTHADMEGDLCQLEALGLIRRWADAGTGRRLLLVSSFLEHQRINRPSKSRLPAPPGEPSMNPHGSVTEPSLSPHANDSQEVEVEVEVEVEGEGEAADQPSVSHQPDVTEAATLLVMNQPQETTEVIEVLRTAYGHQAVADAVTDLTGRYAWPSDLRKALTDRLDADLAEREEADAAAAREMLTAQELEERRRRAERDAALATPEGQAAAEQARAKVRQTLRALKRPDPPHRRSTTA